MNVSGELMKRFSWVDMFMMIKCCSESQCCGQIRLLGLLKYIHFVLCYNEPTISD